MSKTAPLAALAVACALFAQPAFAGDAAATVNGVAIPNSRVDMQARSAAAQGQPDSPELRKAIVDDLVNLEIMSQEAKRLGLDKNDEVQHAIEMGRLSLLSRAFMQNYAKNHPISEDQLKQEYDNLKTRLGKKEYSIRIIPVATESEAKDIIAQLGKKAKFEKLAEKSPDETIRKNGGRLGWRAPTLLPPPLANAVLELQKGQYSKTPVQVNKGWGVVQVDDIRDLKLPPFDELRPSLQQELQQQAIQKAILDLRSKAKIE